MAALRSFGYRGGQYDARMPAAAIHPDTLWALAGVVVSLVTGLGAAMAAMSPPSMRAARWCFWLSAVCLAATSTGWSFLAPYSLTTRSAVATAGVLTAGVGLIALLRWVSARERQPGARPEVTAEWIKAGEQVLVRLTNDGPVAAYHVQAVAWINEGYAIRIEHPSLRRISARDAKVVVPIVDSGPTQPIVSPDHAMKVFRVATNTEQPAARDLRRLLDQPARLRRMMTGFDPPPPDVTIRFDVTYTDFEGRQYATPHMLEYFDETGEIHVRLANTQQPTGTHS